MVKYQTFCRSERSFLEQQFGPLFIYSPVTYLARTAACSCGKRNHLDRKVSLENKWNAENWIIMGKQRLSFYFSFLLKLKRGLDCVWTEVAEFHLGQKVKEGWCFQHPRITVTLGFPYTDKCCQGMRAILRVIVILSFSAARNNLLRLTSVIHLFLLFHFSHMIGSH